MRVRKGGAARALGVATSAVVVALVPAGIAHATPSYAAPDNTFSQIVNGTLVISGTAADDTVTLAPSTDPAQVVVDLNGNAQLFDANAIQAVVVGLGNGNDVFNERAGILSGIPLTLDAGRGDDHITTADTTDVVFGDGGDDSINTGRGNDLIFAGNGDDFVDGGVGNDTALLGQGNDTFQWDPGDGSDVIDGGEGHSDTMLFNGAAVADTASLSANGHAAVFLRQPANIRMDLDNVEQVQFNALGGTDTMTVGDMQGTDVRQVDVNVGANGADGVLDNVIVNGSDHADHVNVTGEASTVHVDGLRAETTVTGADTRDQLQINTGAGNDTVNVDGTATSLIGVTADLGADQH